jgi:NAD(P)-dependent dehydrogenase (short-subunit alcohol dehydrogenase family)
MGWNDPVAVVTGGARGLVRATARLLAHRGAAVCVNYVAHPEAARALAAEIRGEGGGSQSLRTWPRLLRSRR